LELCPTEKKLKMWLALDFGEGIEQGWGWEVVEMPAGRKSAVTQGWAEI